jgi:hypothetical protein
MLLSRVIIFFSSCSLHLFPVIRLDEAVFFSDQGR